MLLKKPLSSWLLRKIKRKKKGEKKMCGEGLLINTTLI